jgi:hypothetical protein
MLELDGITAVRRPDGSRWKDGGLFRYSVRLVDRDLQYEGEEETSIEEIQSYPAFQRFVAREFGAWFRYLPAEDPATGLTAWSDQVSAVWGRERRSYADEGSSDAYSDSDAEPAPSGDA